MFDKYSAGGEVVEKHTLRGNMTEKFMTPPYLGRWRAFVPSTFIRSIRTLMECIHVTYSFYDKLLGNFHFLL